MKTSLVIMSAGLGSRYGGNKQVAGIGPNGEMLMEYSIYDAVRAGFERIVLIIKPDMQELMDNICGYLNKMTTNSDAPLEVVYAFQDFSSVPELYTIPDGRTKPFGTVHALLCAEKYVDGPCCVINADDYYGVDAYNAMYQALETLQPEGQAVMVGYLLKNTASLNGTVSRGVCKVKDGKLESIKETKNIQLYNDGSIIDLTENKSLDPDSVVSMNYWGVMPSIFPIMKEYFNDFLKTLPPDEIKAECLLPIMVDDFMKNNGFEVKMVQSKDKWFGMTYQEDKLTVSEKLKSLHQAKVYPKNLRNI